MCVWLCVCMVHASLSHDIHKHNTYTCTHTHSHMHVQHTHVQCTPTRAHTAMQNFNNA